MTTGNATGCAEGRTGCVRDAREKRVRVLPGYERTRPVPVAADAHTSGQRRKTDRLCPEAGSYCGASGTGRAWLRAVPGAPNRQHSRRLRHQAAARRCEWVTRSSELNPWVTSALPP
ncbi:hypothetical protein GCM10023336_58580 [Streptomyces similanensis]|uniref:Uncharacterized protein n=1 Tax=Streptomyces similanensis TaxID=1274988 RepID=A0ABP9LAK1_9ACTN